MRGMFHKNYRFFFKSFETDVFNFSSCTSKHPGARGGIDPMDILQGQPLEVCLWLKNAEVEPDSHLLFFCRLDFQNPHKSWDIFNIN